MVTRLWGVHIATAIFLDFVKKYRYFCILFCNNKSINLIKTNEFLVISKLYMYCNTYNLLLTRNSLVFMRFIDLLIP